MKKCYYDILDVNSKATVSEIKSNYRKLALKYHPDKNSSEDAKIVFVELTEAYEVLSDPNERTWYDNNREKILLNKDEMSKEDIEMYTFGFNVWTYFSVSCFKGFGDNEGGLYQVYRDVFEKIKTEETKAYNMREDLEDPQRKFEGFGDSHTTIEKVLKFYEDWDNFTTYKTFIWSDEWDTREAQNRYVRRQMEKENKKERQTEKKKYIKTIKDMIAFLRKRDPRYREYVLEVEREKERRRKEEEEKELLKKKQKLDMKEKNKELEEERFKEVQEYFKQQQKQYGDSSSDAEYMEEFEYRCELCSKNFKSENQYKNHLTSKAHKTALKDIKKQVMVKQDYQTEITEEQKQPEKPKKKRNRKKNKNKDKEEAASQQDKDEKTQEKVQEKVQEKIQEKIQEKVKQPEIKQKTKNKKQKSPKKRQPKSQTQSEDDSQAFMAAMLNRPSKNNIGESQKPAQQSKKAKKVQVFKESSSDQQENQNQAKKGKAKQKKEKKGEQQKNPFRCNVCESAFASKTKLFDHIKKSGHALRK